jgi:hypothetical protein
MCRVRVSCRRRQDQGDADRKIDDPHPGLRRQRKRWQPPARRPWRVAANRIHAARFTRSFMHVVPRSCRSGRPPAEARAKLLPINDGWCASAGRGRRSYTGRSYGTGRG